MLKLTKLQPGHVRCHEALIDLLLELGRQVVDVFEVDGDDGMRRVADAVDGRHLELVL